MYCKLLAVAVSPRTWRWWWWWWWLSTYNAPKNSMHSMLVAPSLTVLFSLTRMFSPFQLYKLVTFMIYLFVFLKLKAIFAIFHRFCPGLRTAHWPAIPCQVLAVACSAAVKEKHKRTRERRKGKKKIDYQITQMHHQSKLWTAGASNDILLSCKYTPPPIKQSSKQARTDA